MYVNICREIVKKESRHSTVGNALVCVAVTLAFTFWRFEQYISPHIMSPLLTAAAVMMIFSWFGLSFASGLLDRCGFAVFTAIFWNVPPVICILADRMTPRTFTAALYLAGKYSELLGPYPLGGLPIFRNMDYVTSAAAFSCICLMAYLVGMLSMRSRASSERSRNSNV